MSLEAFPGSICLFLPLTPGSLTDFMLAQSMEPQKNHTEIWQTGTHCDCISKKIPLLELNLRQHNNVERIYSIISALGFLNKPLVWNNCCQIACICTESYCKDPFRMESYLPQSIHVSTVLWLYSLKAIPQALCLYITGLTHLYSP